MQGEETNAFRHKQVKLQNHYTFIKGFIQENAILLFLLLLFLKEETKYKVL